MNTWSTRPSACRKGIDLRRVVIIDRAGDSTDVSSDLPEMEARTQCAMFAGVSVTQLVKRRILTTPRDDREDHGFPVAY